MTAQSLATLAAEYRVAEQTSATINFDFVGTTAAVAKDPVIVARKNDNDDQENPVLAFVIPQLLSAEECDALVQDAEQHGLEEPSASAGTLRTAKRTSQYQNEKLSKKIFARLEREPLFQALDETDGLGEFVAIHTNWRVLRYDTGDSFPAHQDQMESLQIKHDDGTKDFVVSSHTLLIHLTGSGGATRLYPDAKVKTDQPGQYNGRSIDVLLPRGWALVFRQKGLLHAGQPVTGVKYVAQAGVLRKLPKDKLIQPSVFRLGPGLNELVR